MRALIKNSYIYSANDCEFHKGELSFADGKIIDVCEQYDRVIDAAGALVVPGFVDIHTHGRAGFDFCSAMPNELDIMAKSYISAGTTSLFPTLASDTFENLLTASDRINVAKGKQSGAEFLGVHLEGRYLNPEKRGAHAAELLHELDPDELELLIGRMCLPCHITAALELDRNGFAERAVSLGATLSLGHTNADYATAVSLYEKYGIGFSHLFNAMPPLGHRDSGAICAGLTSGAYCELICDGIHIAPEMIKLAYKCLGNERFCLITDSMEASGCPDGNYSIAGNPCVVRNGMAMTLEGKLAGSTLDMKTAVENLMRFCSVPFCEALRCATLTPAEKAGVSAVVGSLDPGKRADILFVREKDAKLSIEKTICGGIVYE